MKNPFLLFYTWLILLFFAYCFRFYDLGFWAFLLGISYIFLISSFWFSLGVLSLSVFVLGAWSSLDKELFFFLSFQYLMMLFLRYRILRPSLYTKAFVSYLGVGLFYFYLHKSNFESLQNIQGKFIYLLQAFLYYLYALGFWYFMDEWGAQFEEKYFVSREQDSQLNLFTVRQLKKMERSSPFKFQKRIRRRFGLKDW